MEKEKKRETWKEAKEKHGKNIGKNMEMEETQKHIKSIKKIKRSQVLVQSNCNLSSLAMCMQRLYIYAVLQIQGPYSQAPFLLFIAAAWDDLYVYKRLIT